MPRGYKLIHEEYVKRAKDINPNIEVLDEYVNSQTKILHRCKVDGYEWYIKPNDILNGFGCPMCYRSKKKKTHEEYVKEVAKINPNIEVIESYISNKIKILHRCKIDGYEWLVDPSHVLRGQNCPRCGGRERYQHSGYVERVARINPNIAVVETYINNQTKILHRCKIDGYEWMAAPNHILRNVGCPVCSGTKKRTQDEYIKDVANINPYIIVIGKYKSNKTKIMHKCKICEHEWLVRPTDVLDGFGCPKCNISKGEKNIAAWLDAKNILYESQKKFDDCKNVLSLSFDFYLPNYNILIEYNGKQHYEPIEYFGGHKTFENQILRDNIKKEYCKKNNIFLIEIPYYSNLDDELEKLYKMIKTKNIEKGVVA